MSDTSGPRLYEWQENVQECQNVAKELGYLQGKIKNGKVTKDSRNAFYMGAELFERFPEEREIKNGCGGYYLKADVAGGTGSGARTKNRVVVLVDRYDKPVHNKGWLWRHDGRIQSLVPRFFDEAKRYESV